MSQCYVRQCVWGGTGNFCLSCFCRCVRDGDFVCFGGGLAGSAVADVSKSFFPLFHNTIGLTDPMDWSASGQVLEVHTERVLSTH